jgi:sugar phosphate isomerase/epimerase
MVGMNSSNSTGIRFYGRTQPLSQISIGEALDALKRVGFDGVEICLEHPDIAPERLDAELVGRVKGQCDELGLGRSVSLHKDFIHDDAMLRDTLTAIRWTRAFGAEVLVIAGSRPRGERESEWQLMIERTRELVKAAEAEDVILAVEFEPAFIVGSTADLHRMFEAIPSPHLQANLDIGHVFLCDPDPLAAIESLKGRIPHGHIENMARGVHRHLPPWEGDMDLKAYLQTLTRIGFAGPMALDLYKEDYREVSPRSLEHLRSCLPK